PVRSLWSRHLAGGPDGSGVFASAENESTALQDLLDAECGQADIHLRRHDGSAALVRASVAPVDAPEARCWTLILRELGAEARATPMVLPGKGAGFIGSSEDVTDGRRHEEVLAHQANHDPLTGLPNRTLLWSTLTEILQGRRASDPAVALLFFDLDNFKLVND